MKSVRGWIALMVLASAPHAFGAAMDFNSALKTILDRDPEIQIARSARDATVGQNLYTRYSLLPSLTLEGSKGRYTPGGYTTQAIGRAKMNLFHFGADLAALDAAHASENAADSKVDQTLLDRESAAVKALVNYIQLVQQNQILAQLEKMQGSSLDVAQREYRAGRIAVQEMEKVQIDLENVRSRIGVAAIDLETARGTLIQLLGSDNVITEWPWKNEIIREQVPPTLRAEDFFPARPDYRIANQQFEAQDRLSAQAFRSMLPSLDASFTYGLVKDSTLTNRFEKEWSGVLTLSIPIFNRLVDYSNYRYQSALRASADSFQTEVIRRVQSEFDSVPKRFLDAQKTALARENILKLSNRLYQANLTRFKLGRASSNELNIDLNRYLDTQLNAIAGWALAHTAYTDFAHLFGKSVLTRF